MNLYDKIKIIEKEYDYKIPKNKHLIVRIDGHKFSKFTKKFKKEKPFSEIISDSMIETTKQLFERFGAYTAYTQSDEITLIFPSLLFSADDGWTHIYDGRIQKISSLCAGFATNIFINEIYKRTNELHNVYFDARVFATDSDIELCEALYSRIKDGIRNSKQSFSYYYAGHKQLLGKKADEQIEFVKNKYGVDWNMLSSELKYGVIFKKELYMKDNNIVRSRIKKITNILPNFNCCDDKFVKIVKEKYYES